MTCLILASGLTTTTSETETIMELPHDDHDLPGDITEVGRPEKTALEQRQETLAHMVRLVARKASVGLFVFGSGGTGKSRTILATLREDGIEPVLINSHVTPLALYGTLFIHREEKVILFDDVDAMFSSMAHLGLLRSALHGNPTRVVTYGSSQLPKDLPPCFEFTSRCIFAANVIPSKNEAFKAVLSRLDIFELSASNEEVIEAMRAISANGFHNLTPDDCSTVIDFIAEHSGDRQLSLRLLGPSLRKLTYCRAENIDWRPLLKSQLQSLGRRTDVTKRLDNKAKDFRALELVLRQFPDLVNEQQAEWCRLMGKSRASFYRTLARYRDELGDE